MHAAVQQALVHPLCGRTVWLPSSCDLYLGPLVDAMVLPAELKQLIDANLDRWHKGSKVLEAGIKASLLPPNSVAIEVGNGAKKAAQVEANKAMVASSQGLLAAWGGG